MKQLWALSVFLFVGILSSLSAFGVDGVVLINQASVMAAGGFPYHITQSGSYRLSGNLVVPAGVDGIDINASNVTLDLNGFSILGPNTCFGTPLSCTANTLGSGITVFGDATIKSGSVQGMYLGIAEGVGSSALIEEVTATQNANTGLFLPGSAGIVRRCRVILNFFGMSLSSGVVEDNVVSSNALDGIIADTFGIHGTTIIGNSVNSNGGHGLVPSDALYGSNVLWGNTAGDIDSSAVGAVSQKNNNCSGTTC